MTAFAVVLMAALDVWSVSPATADAAKAGIPGWWDQASRSLPEVERTDLHLDVGFPVFNIDESATPAFLADLNPRHNAHNWQVIYPVLDRENRAIGWISVMVFDDSRGPKAGGYSWGRSRLAFVTQVEETKRMPDVDRILGVVTSDVCGPDLWVVYVDRHGNASKRAFSSTFDFARTVDTIVVGTLSDVRVRGLTLTESPDSSVAQTRSFDLGTISVERALKGGWSGGNCRICFPSRAQNGDVPSFACPPNVRVGDRRIWFLDSSYVMLTRRLMLWESRGAVSLDYLDQVEKEIAEDAHAPAPKVSK
jgi:hypothetical protein